MSRKATLPGVQRDIDALLGDEASPPGAKPTNGDVSGGPREVDRAALVELASQFPSAGGPPRPLDPAPAVATMEATAATLDPPIVAVASAPAAGPATPAAAEAAPRSAFASAVHALDGALFGSNPMRRWAVMAGIVLVGLVVVVLLEAALLSSPGTPVAAPPTATVEGQDELRARLADAEGRLDATEAAARETARSLAALKDQMTARAANGGDPSRSLLAAIRIETLANAGRPFATELAAMRGMAGTGDLAETIDRLAPFAEAGVPTRRDLAARASAQAPRLTAMAAESDGMLGGLFTRRPTTEAVTATVLARAQAEIESGDLTGAIRQLQRLPATLRQAAMPWIVAAERRVELDAAVDGLTVGAFQAMATAR